MKTPPKLTANVQRSSYADSLYHFAIIVAALCVVLRHAVLGATLAALLIGAGGAMDESQNARWKWFGSRLLAVVFMVAALSAFTGIIDHWADFKQGVRDGWNAGR